MLIAKQQGYQTSGNWRIRDQGRVDSSRNRHSAESWIPISPTHQVQQEWLPLWPPQRRL